MARLTSSNRRRRSNRQILYIGLMILAIVLLILGSCRSSKGKIEEPPATPDPYEGMIQVSDGMGGLMWVKHHEEFPINELESDKFHWNGKYLGYSGGDYEAITGIDVSIYQGDIDWNAVKEDGIRFAMIRCGYRGYSEGVLNEDENFHKNIQGALAAGLDVGVYVFSQATTMREAEEEAELALSMVQGYNITYPIAFDWENIEGAEARTNNIYGEELTRFSIAFCDKIRDGGYEPCVYLYRRLGYFEYDLPQLSDLKLWISAPGDRPDFYYEHFMWQYSFTGNVSGIDGDVDLNLHFVKKANPGSEG